MLEQLQQEFVYLMNISLLIYQTVNSSTHRQNGRHFAYISYYIFFNKTALFIKISPKFIPKAPVDNEST